MQKDEAHLIRPWVEYHSNLFGIENLFIWDNGSTDTATKHALRAFEALGANVYWALNNEIDFRRKGNIIGEKIKELDRSGIYDFYFPIDCDEFLVLRLPEDTIAFDRKSISIALSQLINVDEALGMNWAYYNIIGHNGYYWRLPHKKTFFRSATFKAMDHGYHEGKSTLSEGRYDTNLAYMHYHYKPHAIIVEHSKNKLRPYMNIDDPDTLKAAYETNRLARFILDDEASYMKKFSTDKAIYIPEFEEGMRASKIAPPFS